MTFRPGKRIIKIRTDRSSAISGRTKTMDTMLKMSSHFKTHNCTEDYPLHVIAHQVERKVSEPLLTPIYWEIVAQIRNST